MRYEANCRSKDNSKVRYNTNTRKATAGRAKGEAMKNAAYYNGTISAIEVIKVPLEDRAVYFGDGVYDVAFCHNGKPFLIDEHFDRFYNSCRLVRIDFPYTREQLLEIITDLISRLDDRSDVLIYWQASRGTAPRNHPFPENSKANLLMYVKPKKITKLDVPMKLHTVDDIRYEMCNVKTINLIPNILAAQAAIDAGCDEAVQIRRRLFEEDGTEYRDVVTEGAHTNISILKNGEFITAPLGHFILPGIARSHLIGLCRANGIPVVERYITRAELADADEIMISSTTTLVRRACELDGAPVGGRDTVLFDRIQQLYVEKLDRDCI